MSEISEHAKKAAEEIMVHCARRPNVPNQYVLEEVIQSAIDHTSTRAGMELINERDQLRTICDEMAGVLIDVGGGASYVSYIRQKKLNAILAKYQQVKKTKCVKCNDQRTIRVLGNGGDYEDWPCPDCQQIKGEGK